MKKIFLLLMWVIISGATLAQKTLEFNQVLLIGSTPQTVPTGKVWKVESIMSQQAYDYKKGMFIKINGDSIAVHQFYSGAKFWDNISKIVVEGKRDNSTTCTYDYNRVFFSYSGFDGDLPVKNVNYYYQQNLTSSSYITLFNIVPQSGTSLSITSWRLSPGYRFTKLSVRVTVFYTNGTSQSLVYSKLYDDCGGSNDDWVFGTTQGTEYQVPMKAQDTYFNPPNLPMWLPEGTSLQSFINTKYISVVEFNLVP